MPRVDEAVGGQSLLGPTLTAGITTLSEGFQLTFVKYVKIVLPVDLYVYWVNASILSPDVISATSAYNAAAYAASSESVSGANVVTVPGSLHHSISARQTEDTSTSINTMTFTAESEIQDFNTISPQVMYIAKIDNELFSFSQRRNFYKQADKYHYVGEAVYPTMRTQVIDDISQLDLNNRVVSNSLPIWLTLNKFFPMYPSYLVPDNLPPPYASVHIPTSSTRAMQAAPLRDDFDNHYQLSRDNVEITIFGSRNFSALDFQDYIFRESLKGSFGIMAPFPVMQDAKQFQVEISTLAMRKEFKLTVSYNQSRIREIARQFIESVIVQAFFLQNQ